MSDASTIEWTDATWNPVRGCTKVSPGCKNCYAERFAERFRGVKGHAYERGFDVRTVPSALDVPLKWRKPRRIFVNSMSDLFHKDVPDDFIMSVFATMARARQHTFQVLTKRADRMRDLLLRWRSEGLTMREGYGVALPNVWLGVSVEDQKRADERIPHLLATPAAVRFLSCEPLLEQVDLISAGAMAPMPSSCEGPFQDLPEVDWVIVGGESGPGARPFNILWARQIIEQCKAAGVPAFVKQLGAHAVRGLNGPDADLRPTVIGRKGNVFSEWPNDLRVRQFPAVAAP